MEKSMKKGTLILWVVIFGFFALFIFQNQTFFLAKNAFHLNFGIKEYSIPELYNAVLVLVFFCCGLIIAFLFSFSARFKAKRTIKKLNATIDADTTEMDKLKGEIVTLKDTDTPVDGQVDTIKLDVNTTQKITDEATAESPADKAEKIGADKFDANPGEDTVNLEVPTEKK